MAGRRRWVAVALLVAFALGIATGVVGLKARQARLFAGTPFDQVIPPTPTPVPPTPTPVPPTPTPVPPTPTPVPPTPIPTEPPMTVCAGAADSTAFVEPAAHKGPFDSIALPTLATTPALRKDGAPIDQTGVRIHPAGTAAFGIAYLNIGDEASAIRMAKALLASSESEGDKLWFPYQFRFDVGPWDLPSGWVSGYAQGISLAFLVRLAEATGDSSYRNAADAVFRTLLPGEGVSRLDGQDFWVEEYPETPPNTIYNGHVYGTLALYEYDRLVGSPRARQLALQGIATIRRHIPEFVMADGSAYYDASRFTGKINVNYHLTYIQMFSWLGSVTGEPCFLDVGRAVARRLGGAP